MPSYEYEIPEAGVRITLIRPVERRDEPVHVRRIEVPAHVAIAGSAAHPLDCDAGARQGWKRMEESGELARIKDFKPSEVKRALETAEARTAAGLNGD